MFEFNFPTPATLTSVTPRTEVHGEDRVFAVTLGLKLEGPNTLLDKLSPTIRQALYTVVPDQDQLPGVEPSTPLLRSRVIEEVKLGPSCFEGWTLAVDHGIDDQSPIKIGGCKVDKFRCVPKEGGSIELLFRVGSNDIDATEAGLLCSHLSQEISFTLTAPEKPIDPIDGTQKAFDQDHPSAEDLFSAGAETDADDGEDGDPSIWPFPEDFAHRDLPDPESSAMQQEVEQEIEPTNTRTERGRAATKQALAAKYRDPMTGSTWSGRGLQPAWIRAALARGAALNDFDVASARTSPGQ